MPRPPKPAACVSCEHVYAMDPVLTVPCPVCDAPIGQRCLDRHPSGHVMSIAFGNLPPWGHDARDLAAAAAGAYDCGCGAGISPEEARRRLKLLNSSGKARWRDVADEKLAG